MGDGDHLVAIHDHLRGELAQLRALVEEVERGHTEAAEARHAISTMTLRQNDWTLGVYCQTYCRVVTMHHSIEDQAMYPRLRAADPALGPALDRMVEEHHAVHGRLEELDRALVVLVADPDAGVAGVGAALEALEVTLLEHLAYEEDQLVEPLNRLGFGL
jgi:hemerythrin-like domain-containing protein